MCYLPPSCLVAAPGLTLHTQAPCKLLAECHSTFLWVVGSWSPVFHRTASKGKAHPQCCPLETRSQCSATQSYIAVSAVSAQWEGRFCSLLWPAHMKPTQSFHPELRISCSTHKQLYWEPQTLWNIFIGGTENRLHLYGYSHLLLQEQNPAHYSALLKYQSNFHCQMSPLPHPICTTEWQTF